MSVEHYYEHENMKICSAWHCAVHYGLLEKNYEFKLKISVEHYYEHENMKIWSARHCAAHYDALEITMNVSLK